ncbi:hypothetical protein [Chelativorans intermedius]|uniref:Uncharacterized protein n=1 Tax=Chelativorans intermedius TaxID=515947 RepID=A0ABV6D7J5_9HYPH|nr:hypothetical protein [Chelativorans intermedius]MCT8999219.1 hypothetical protein [Chelativorans intermedius]
MIEPKPTITAEALALCRDHPLAEDTGFLIQLSESLARLHPTAPLSERLAILNKTTAEHAERADADAVAKARAESAKAERERIAAILRSPEANGRMATAMALALDGDTPADAAIAALKAAPKSSALDAWSQQPAPAEPPAVAGPRTLDGEGLLTPDGSFVTVAAEPAPVKAAGSGAKALWRKAIAEVNQKAKAG